MNEANEYDILLEIFRFIRDYSTANYSLSDVCMKLLRSLRSAGHEATMTAIDRDTRLAEVDGHRYQILRRDGWSKYDVIRTA